MLLRVHVVEREACDPPAPLRVNPSAHTDTVNTVAATVAMPVANGCSVPNIAMLVNVAKMPPAGVMPPYMNDWKAAAIVPA